MSPNTQFKTDILVDFGNLKPLSNWCESNCSGDWGYECLVPAGADAGTYEFYFEAEHDYVNFILWKK